MLNVLNVLNVLNCLTQMIVKYKFTIGGNREMDQLCTTSQVSNITGKTIFSHIS